MLAALIAVAALGQNCPGGACPATPSLSYESIYGPVQAALLYRPAPVAAPVVAAPVEPVYTTVQTPVYAPVYETYTVSREYYLTERRPLFGRRFGRVRGVGFFSGCR